MTTDRETLLAILAQSIVEYDPSIDTGPGAISSLLISPATVLAESVINAVEDSIDKYDLSLLSSTTDEALLDEMASRYGVIRSASGFASGTVTVVLDTDFPLVITAGTEFITQAGVYTATASFAFRQSASAVINANDRLLIARGDGTYVANITVRATTVGEALNLTQGTSLTLATDLEHVLSLYAARDFTGGIDSEVGADLLTRIKDSRTRPGAETAWGIEALIRDPGNFPLVDSVSVVGSLDEEMRRDKDNAFGIGGGMSDIYVRTRRAPSTVAVSKTGEDLGVTSGKRRWSISIDRTDFPGWWDVVSVTDAVGRSLKLISDNRDVDLTATQGQITPIIPVAAYGTFSAFQIAEIVVEGVDESDNGAFTVSLRGMPQIDEVQQLLGGRRYRPVGGDVLVKAPSPVFVFVNITIEPSTSTSEIPTDQALTQLIINCINRTGFTGKLHASQIADAVSGEGYSAVNVLLAGYMLLPDGTRRNMTSESYLEIPQLRSLQTSWRTAVFVSAPNMVTVTRQEPSSELLK